MSARKLRVAAAITITCLGAAVAIGACGDSGSSGSSGGKQSKEKVEAQRFLNELDAAVRQGDLDLRIARLNPAVIQRYGEQQCRDFLASLPQDATRRDRVKTVEKVEPFQYSNDGAAPVDAMVVHVKGTVQGKKGDRNLHLARVNGQLTYFIDCGTPLPGQ
jgi:hypothetical protein